MFWYKLLLLLCATILFVSSYTQTSAMKTPFSQSPLLKKQDAVRMKMLLRGNAGDHQGNSEERGGPAPILVHNILSDRSSKMSKAVKKAVEENTKSKIKLVDGPNWNAYNIQTRIESYLLRKMTPSEVKAELSNNYHGEALDNFISTYTQRYNP
ncbi:RxLR effector protein [Phytophthora megakarya]|uniref:RxLR effector protein n=1 Tax=Phytophthora megakarya TaxID=4795 RepID=A0A225WUD5_9STRA|nr:RxLR effector protein [Phytophthora megakarya]